MGVISTVNSSTLLFHSQQRQLIERSHSFFQHILSGKFPPLSNFIILFYKSKYDPKEAVALNIFKCFDSEEYTDRVRRPL